MSPQSHQRGSKMRATVLAAALGLSLVVASSVVDAQHGPVVSGTQASDFTTPPASCDTAIIGGGPGGVYAALRLLESGAVANGTATAPGVCLFEANGRVGGRVYSVHNMGEKNDLTVDMGAYRYNRVRMGVITDIIERLLKLPTRFYQPGNNDYHIIERPDGTSAGFTTYVEGMLNLALDRGLNITFNARVISVNQTASGFQLTLATGKMVAAKRVIMNLPATPLHRLLANSNLPDRVYNGQLYAPYPITAGKVYAYYPHAWWIEQGLTRPEFIDSPVWPPVQFPFSGRFYDGEVRCPIKNDPRGRTRDFVEGNSTDLDLTRCYGFLELFYEAEHGGQTSELDVFYPEDKSYEPFVYLSDYAAASSPDVPYFVQTNSTPDGSALLNTAHTRLINYLEDVGYHLSVGTVHDLPSQAVVVIWNEAVSWAGGGWHYWKDNNQSTVAAVASSVQPFPKLQLFLCNEGYAEYQHWSEGSLTMAENIVRTHFNASVAPWMRPQVAADVLYNKNYTEFQGPMER